MAQRVCLSVLRGPRAGEVFFAQPGQRLVVGRTSEAGVWISDPGISRRHFELDWDGNLCRVADLGSTNGTLVNGQLVRDAILRDGDRIEAGDTTFRIEIRDEPLITTPPPGASERPAARAPEPAPELSAETAPAQAEGEPARAEAAPPQAEAGPRQAEGEPARDEPKTLIMPVAIFESVTPVPEAARAREPARGALLEKLSASLGKEANSRLYALIDGAQSSELAFRARLMGSELYTLFSGSMAVEVAHAGPCLAPLPSALPFLEKWAEALGSNAGILFESSAELDALYRHLRRIFVVTDEEDQEYFFRYYDPRVLRVYLPTCTPDELREFFGPVTRWIAEDEKGEGYRIYELGDGNLLETALGA